MTMAAVAPCLFPWPQLAAGNFAAFRDLYPKRVKMRDAERAWAKLTPQDQIECLRELPRHIEHWERTHTERRFIPNPASFLNGHRWKDEIGDPRDPLRDHGQCAWNRNGNREEGKPRCAERAFYTDGTVNYFCTKHAATLGLLRKRPT